MNFLPGWFPVLAAAAGASIVQVASASNSANVVCPSVNAGDLIVHLDYSLNNIGSPTTVIPTGFTQITNNVAGSVARQIASYKIAAGSEGGTTLTGMSGNIATRRIVVTFRRSPVAIAATVSTPNGEGTSGNPALQNVAASGGVAPLIVFGCYGSDGSVDPRTFSPAKDNEVAQATNLYLAWRVDNGAGQDTSIDMDDEGNANILQSFYIALS